MSYRIEAATKQEWAARALMAEAENKRLKAALVDRRTHEATREIIPREELDEWRETLKFHIEHQKLLLEKWGIEV